MNLGKVNYYNHSSKPNCVFVENKELPLICIDLWFKAGSAFEESNKSGTAHFLEHMIFKGSCLLYTSPSPRDATLSRMPSSA